MSGEYTNSVRTSPGGRRGRCGDSRRPSRRGCRLISSRIAPRLIPPSNAALSGSTRVISTPLRGCSAGPAGRSSGDRGRARSARATDRRRVRCDRPAAGAGGAWLWARSRLGRSASFTMTSSSRPSRSDAKLHGGAGRAGRDVANQLVVVLLGLAVERDDHVVGPKAGALARRSRA